MFVCAVATTQHQ